MASDRYETPPAWRDTETKKSEREEAIAKARAEAKPVFIVGINIRFEDVFVLMFHMFCASLIFSVIIGFIAWAILKTTGVL